MDTKQVLLAILFLLIIGTPIFYMKGIIRSENKCSYKCMDEGWPQSHWSNRRDTCYCKNKLKSLKLYQENQ